MYRMLDLGLSTAPTWTTRSIIDPVTARKCTGRSIIDLFSGSVLWTVQSIIKPVTAPCMDIGHPWNCRLSMLPWVCSAHWHSLFGRQPIALAKTGRSDAFLSVCINCLNGMYRFHCYLCRSHIFYTNVGSE